MNEAKGGFSLIEVLIAAFVLVVAVTASAALFSGSIATTAGNRYRTIAVTLVQDKMEDLRHRKTLQPGNYSELVNIPVSGPGQEFLRSWRVEPGPAPRRVTVAVFRRRYFTHGPYDELARSATMVAPRF
jgi:prepilin-type N-terminal cleavage/methylation domain-containing protein